MSTKSRGGKEALVGDLVEQLLSSRGMTTQLQKYRAWSCWNEVVGPQIARHAQPLRVRDQILEVRVSQPAWMQQLQLLKPKILQQLNQRLGENLIEDIYLKRGAVAPPEEPRTETRKATQPLTDEDRTVIDGILEGLDDHDLRSSLSGLIGKDIQSKKETG